MIATNNKATIVPNVLKKTSKISPLLDTVIVFCKNSIEIPNKKAEINEKI